MPQSSTPRARDTRVLAAIEILGRWAQLDVIATVVDLELADASTSVARLESRGQVIGVGSGTFAVGMGTGATFAVQTAILSVMHLRAADELRRRGAADEEVCRHLAQAPGTGNPEHVDVLRRQARQMLTADRPHEAVACLRRALHEPPPAELLDELQLELAEALLEAGSFEEAVEVGRRIRLRERDPDRDAAAAVVIARGLASQGHGEQASWVLIREIERFARRGPELAVRLRGELVRLTPLARQPLSAWLRYHSRQPPGAQGSISATPHGLLEATQLAMTGSMSAKDAVRVALERLAAEPIGLADESGQLSAVWLLIRADEPGLARRALTEIRAASGDRLRPQLAAMSGLLRLRFEAVSTAVTELDEAFELGRALRSQVVVGPALAFLAAALFEADQKDRLAQLLEGHHPDSLPDNSWSAILRVVRGRHELAEGRPEEAVRYLLRVESDKSDLGLTNPACFHHLEPAVDALRALGRPADALELAELNLRRAGAWGSPITLALARGALARCVPNRQAVELLNQAVTLLAPSAPNLYHAQLLRDLGPALVVANRRQEAAAALGAALDEATQIGAERIAKEAHVELRALGRRPRRPAIHGVDALTPAEKRIATLAARGDSNKMIASLLHLSVRTVENHLRHVYQKLSTDRSGLTMRRADLEPAWEDASESQ